LNALRPAAAAPRVPGDRFAAAMIALTIACLFAIFTTSNWGTMPLLLTLLLAFPTAWLGFAADDRNTASTPIDIQLPLAGAQLGAYPGSGKARSL